MKKTLFVISFVFAAFAANASFLWWQVTPETSGMGKVSDWDTAVLYAVKGSEYTAIETLDNDGDPALPGGTILGQTDITSYSSEAYSFYIELVNNYQQANQTLSGYSQQVAYQDLSGSITSTLSEIPSVTVWHGGTFSAPEPTSAMLMLLGVAGLALRRKQRKLA